eukprot:gene7253-2688_t
MSAKLNPSIPPAYLHGHGEGVAPNITYGHRLIQNTKLKLPTAPTTKETTDQL